MAHEMNLSSNDPGCIIFMIDQSGSMGNDWRGTGQTLAYGAAKAVNTVLAELAARCKKGEEISPRVRVGLFGYSEPGRVASVDWASANTSPEADGLMCISTIATINDEVLDEENEVFIPWVVHDHFGGGTPMMLAFHEVLGVAEAFAQSHTTSFPPIIINITDGMPTDMDTQDIPNEVHPLSSIATSDGHALICNVHLSETQEAPAFLPASEDALPDEYSKNLFLASSEVPEAMAKVGRERIKGIDIQENARLFAYNADPTLLVNLLTLASSVPTKE